MSTSSPRPEAEHPPYPLFALAPSYTPNPTTGPAQERALLSLSAHQRTSYDAIPIDHTAPLNASSLIRASLAPDAPPRFLPPSLDPSSSSSSSQTSVAANNTHPHHPRAATPDGGDRKPVGGGDRGFEPVDAADDNNMVTSALAALDASRSAEPGASPDDPCRSEELTDAKSE